MDTTKRRNATTKRFQISVPMSDFEANRLEQYLKESGMKKGAFTRQALQRYLDAQEAAK